MKATPPRERGACDELQAMLDELREIDLYEFQTRSKKDLAATYPAGEFCDRVLVHFLCGAALMGLSEGLEGHLDHIA